LVSSLAELGAAQLAEAPDRHEAVRQTAGLLKEAYPAGYLTELRLDWP
jgi:uncharacterized protein with GYD domain